MQVNPSPQLARYAVAFRVGTAPPAAGALIVDTEAFTLEGRSTQGAVEITCDYRDLRDVHVGRRPSERLNGYATLVVGMKNGAAILIEPLGAGLLHELADLLSGLSVEPMGRAAQPKVEERVLVTVPLRRGRKRKMKELIAHGPPFDPAELGLTRHEVFVTEDHAVFVFEGPDARSTVERATRDPSLWRAWLAWRPFVSGRPRLENEATAGSLRPECLVYSWSSENGPK